MKYFFLSLSFLTLLFCSISCKSGNDEAGATSADSSFSMVFMTDIHIQPELNAVDGFRKAMDTINKLKPELVITGGDLVMDALGQRQSRADSLYELYKTEIKQLSMPVYNTVGNHELFGVYPESGADTTHPLYGVNMFKQKLGNPFYSFTHKNWRFFVLDDIEATKDRKYTGHISGEQIEWLKKELAHIDTLTPLALVVHIPFLSSLSQINKGAMEPNTEGLVVSNSREILDLFNRYNLKLVLQGHLHVLEDNYIKGIHFITGGAICGGWWKGPHEGTQEGFLYLKFNRDSFTWNYVDYNWAPELTIKPQP